MDADGGPDLPVADLAAAVRTSLTETTRRAFERRVSDQAETVRSDLESGLLDNPEYAVGLELEAYAVDESGRLARVPETVFEEGTCAKELGLHNVEVNTPATLLDAGGLERQSTVLCERVAATRDRLEAADLRLVLDAMWTAPPPEGTAAYLDATHEDGDVVVAANMRPNERYCALDNEVLRRAGGSIRLTVPGVDREFPTILLESLATSVQPHLQIPSTDAFPRAFNAAIRTMGPLLSLTSNSPFLPADLYGDDPALVEETHHELRVPVFEQSINAGAPPGEGKVRVPRDIDEPTDVIDRIVADETYAPFLTDPANHGETYGERFPEFDFKRGVYWRWIRGVLGGQPVGSDEDGTSLRIEYRPLPTQPTLADVLAVQSLTVGLLYGLLATAHPLPELEWERARDSFYAAVRDGPNADLAWVTADGDLTRERERIYAELFDLARTGLTAVGVDADEVDDHLRPIERRVAGDSARTPSAWKCARVRSALEDGAALPDSIRRMQEAYVRNAATGTPFWKWD